MHAARTTTLAAVFLAIGILLGTGALTGPPAFSYADPVTGPMPPQYMTATIDANELEAKVGDLARENWEIISIATASQFIDQTIDAKTRIVVEKFQVTARRPSAPPPPLKAK
jgi:hypothetical protein